MIGQHEQQLQAFQVVSEESWEPSKLAPYNKEQRSATRADLASFWLEIQGTSRVSWLRTVLFKIDPYVGFNKNRYNT